MQKNLNWIEEANNQIAKNIEKNSLGCDSFITRNSLETYIEQTDLIDWLELEYTTVKQDYLKYAKIIESYSVEEAYFYLKSIIQLLFFGTSILNNVKIENETLKELISLSMPPIQNARKKSINFLKKKLEKEYTNQFK